MQTINALMPTPHHLHANLTVMDAVQQQVSLFSEPVFWALVVAVTGLAALLLVRATGDIIPPTRNLLLLYYTNLHLVYLPVCLFYEEYRAGLLRLSFHGEPVKASVHNFLVGLGVPFAAVANVCLDSFVVSGVIGVVAYLIVRRHELIENRRIEKERRAKLMD